MTNDEAISILEDEAYFLYEDDAPYDREAFYMAVDALKAQKHGHWFYTGEIFTDPFSLDEFPIYECSVCGSRIERKPTLDKFCNWCGARMDEVSE